RLERTGAALVVATHDRRLAARLASRVWSIAAGELWAHASVDAYLRGEEAVLAGVYWDEQAEAEAAAPAQRPVDAAAPAAQPVQEVHDVLEALEAERSALLELLLDPLASSERDRARAQERLALVEEDLMALYDDGLEPPGPSWRLSERGLDVYAERA